MKLAKQKNQNQLAKEIEKNIELISEPNRKAKVRENIRVKLDNKKKATIKNRPEKQSKPEKADNNNEAIQNDDGEEIIEEDDQ